MNKNLENDFNEVIASKSEIKEFNFASYELNDVEIATISEQEKIFMNTYKKYKNNLFEMCSSLAVIEKTLKPTNSFMAWYESKGLTKDAVSVYLKRWNLYLEFQNYKDKIFAYSDQAIKILTNKELQYEEVLGILENDVYKVKEIRKQLLPAIEKNKMEFLPAGQKYFNFNKIKKMEKRVKKLKDEEREEYKRELTEYVKKLQQLMEEL
ncbi:hypothetical protein [Fusobacterium pseudoperiodonticum]|uniref:hypothetical protein n=1 Tax=Fusobacterium pseudoperiodonticum TaxID=2663009 RepID=UPI00204C6E48|nr:hypothetical protein [Fusobacterium pseudoperiodonticum]DAN01055.1 MAG TPA: hypothetical protein [Caudoviricetes sp.]